MMITVNEFRNKFEFICASNGLDYSLIEMIESTKENEQKVLKVFCDFDRYLKMVQKEFKLTYQPEFKQIRKMTYYRYIPMVKLAFDKGNYSYCISLFDMLVYNVKVIDSYLLHDLIYLFHETIETKDIRVYQ